LSNDSKSAENLRASIISAIAAPVDLASRQMRATATRLEAIEARPLRNHGFLLFVLMIFHSCG
jgi:hypothetical protein